jgi:hypothetical protein
MIIETEENHKISIKQRQLGVSLTLSGGVNSIKYSLRLMPAEAMALAAAIQAVVKNVDRYLDRNDAR